MPLRESEAIIIKSYDLAEADRIIVFFSRSFGIIRGVAKGVKRPGSRFGSTLEPFSKVRISFFQKDERELVSIRDAEIISSRFDAASEPARLATFSYFGDMLMEFAAPHDADEVLFRMLDACLSAGDRHNDFSALEFYFDVWLLRLSGYLPEWRRCSQCGRSRNDMTSARIIAGFSLVCRDCKVSAGAVLQKLHRDELEVFHNVEISPPADFLKAATAHSSAVLACRSVIKRLITSIGGNLREARISFAAFPFPGTMPPGHGQT